MKKYRILKFITISIPFIAVIILFIIKNNISMITNALPACLFNKLTGYLCPACGNTRSVIALMNGDILTSLKYNITPVILTILLVLLYIELITKISGRHIKILPRSNIFWFVFLGLFFIYLFLRNFIPF